MTEQIARLNDAFRKHLSGGQGQLIMTASLAALPCEVQMTLWAHVRAYDDFTPDNDPYGEHDFGAFTVPEVGKIFWKIDYYAPDMQHGSEDPANPKKTMRVLTVMQADEY